jgi:hypothetical protein
MRDEDFDYFIEKFGEATHHEAVPQAAIDKWRGKLPDKLLHYWQTEGWNGYADGRFWTVNPDDYEDIVDEWLEGSRLEQVDAYHAIARGHLGMIYLYGEQTGCVAKIDCALHAIFVRSTERLSSEERERRLPWFFSGMKLDETDHDDIAGNPLFERALQTLGALAPDEMYGFEPALVTGGKMTLERLRKVKTDQHLTLLRQLAPPTMPFGNIDIDKLVKSVKS